MKHFAVSAGLAASPAHNPNKGDGHGMTEHGFKRFQRRRSTAAETPVAPAAPDAVELPQETAEPAIGKSETERRAGLPAPMPEPWERIPHRPFDTAAQRKGKLPLVSRFRTDPAAKSFDLLRTRLLHTLKERGWKRVAVTAPFSGCGATFSAVNLALSMARVPGNRTILMDLNFRRPGVARALGMAASGDMAGFLSGMAPMEELLLRPLPSLAVGLNGMADQNAAELLQSASCPEVLDEMILRSGAETILFDLPPLLEHDDAAAFLPQVDGVLLISDGASTTAAQLSACEKMIGGHAELLGVVLNRARKQNSLLPGE